MANPTRSTPAGWYPDPQAGGQVRYWDGSRWTEHRHRYDGRAPAAARAGTQRASPAATRPSGIPGAGTSGRPSIAGLQRAEVRTTKAAATGGMRSNRAMGRRRPPRAAQQRPSFFEDEHRHWFQSDVLLLVVAAIVLLVLIVVLV